MIAARLSAPVLGLLASLAPIGDGARAAELPWSFAPLVRPSVPEGAFGAWPLDDLDRFIAARLSESGIRPNPGSGRLTLIRRAAFDLVGLPPSLEEIDRFLADPAPDAEAFARVVDGYLARPQFGERWARHWLDVARYADSVGRTWNAPFVYAWRYRDWVVDAFNDDKPYRRFVAEQIAGDLLPAETVAQRREQVIATGFLALGALSINMGTAEGFVLDQIDDQIDVTTRGFLALSVACARCHDHKYDPVAQVDYYALAGIFYSSWTYSGAPHMSDHGSHGYVDPEMLVRLPDDLVSPLDRVRSVPAGIHAMSDLRQFGGQAPPPFGIEPDWAMGLREGKPVDCALREGGMAWDLGETPPRGDLRIPGLPPFPEVPEDASGRLQLARWIASEENPLTARVMVNRVWQHLFGKGLVETVDDFGLTGSEPSHPELLDHLAVRFVEQGWSVKGLIRSLMLSRTYQLGGDHQEAAQAIDPDNALYWRSPPRRLELEALRDSLLNLAGRLETGPPAPGVLGGNGSRGRSRTRGEIGFESPYRTLYLPVIRDFLPDEYGVFDFPDPSAVAGRRHVTTAPPQALFFMNSRFVEECARDAALRVLEGASDTPRRLALAYRLGLGRPPSPEECADAEALLRDSGDSAGSGAGKAELDLWSILMQALFASAEFRYVL